MNGFIYIKVKPGKNSHITSQDSGCPVKPLGSHWGAWGAVFPGWAQVTPVCSWKIHRIVHLEVMDSPAVP